MGSIPEQFLLMTLDARTGEFRRLHGEYLSAGLVGAAVMDLAISGRIDSDVDRAWVAESSPTGSVVLDMVLEEMRKPGFPVQIERVIGALVPLGDNIREAIISNLCDQGVLERSEERNFLFKKVARLKIANRTAVEAAQQKLRDVLLAEDLPDSDEICLIALCKTCGLLEQLMAPKDFERARNRASEVSTLDLIGQNVRRYLYLFERDVRK